MGWIAHSFVEFPQDLGMWNGILFRDKVFYRGSQVKMRTLERLLIQYDQCPSKSGKFEHKDMHRRKMMWRGTVCSKAALAN
jgi:hypothetical protein